MRDETSHQLAVQIVRFVDDHQPGFVACEFNDADGHTQTLVDKVPIFTNEYLDANSRYPRPSHAACIVLQRWRDARGRDLARISTEKPCGIETEDGRSEFVVLASQLTTNGDAA
jgi:hypothetical protein